MPEADTPPPGKGESSMPATFTAEQINALAAELKLEPAAVHAVCEVESAGSGFLPKGAKTPQGRIVAGYPKVLFEPHIFWTQLQKQRPPFTPAKLLIRDDIRKEYGDISDILYQKWRTRPYGSMLAQWDRLSRARGICSDPPRKESRPMAKCKKGKKKK